MKPAAPVDTRKETGEVPVAKRMSNDEFEAKSAGSTGPYWLYQEAKRARMSEGELAERLADLEWHGQDLARAQTDTIDGIMADRAELLEALRAARLFVAMIAPGEIDSPEYLRRRLAAHSQMSAAIARVEDIPF